MINAQLRNRILTVCLLLLLSFAVRLSAAESAVFNIRNFGAAGDGKTLDTVAINKAIDACALAGAGQVLFPPGRYLSGTIHLKSNMTLRFEAGATLLGATNLNEYHQPAVPSFLPEAKWGKWHRALLLGENVENVTLSGTGVIDGNKVFDPTGEERMRGPHTIVLVDCRDVTIRDLSIIDSANYAILFQVSDRIEVRNVKITGGWDGIHFRGGPDRPCRDVTIIGCQFYTGDDSIAGRYWENVVISDCTVNSSCNGVRLIGPATHLIIHNCLFYGPGVRPHRSSNRHNMLSGIILQPGAWDATRGELDDVLITENTMRNVASPITMWLKKGNTAGRIVVSGLKAMGVYRSAISIESYAESPFATVTIDDATIEYEGGGKLDQSRLIVKGPGVDARALPAWAFFARNVGRLELRNIRVSCVHEDLRPVVWAEGVQRLSFDQFSFPKFSGAASPLALTNVAHVEIRGADFALPEPAGK